MQQKAVLHYNKLIDLIPNDDVVSYTVVSSGPRFLWHCACEYEADANRTFVWTFSSGEKHRVFTCASCADGLCNALNEGSNKALPDRIVFARRLLVIRALLAYGGAFCGHHPTKLIACLWCSLAGVCGRRFVLAECLLAIPLCAQCETQPFELIARTIEVRTIRIRDQLMILHAGGLCKDVLYGVAQFMVAVFDVAAEAMQ